MNNIFKALIAGWGAKKLGGGCLSTILVFVIIYWALGQCGNTSKRNQVPEKVQHTQTINVNTNPHLYIL